MYHSILLIITLTMCIMKKDMNVNFVVSFFNSLNPDLYMIILIILQTIHYVSE